MTAVARVAGPQKAALVLLALDEEVAAEVMRHLDDADLKRLAECADGIAQLSAEAMEHAFEEFEKRMREPQIPRGAGDYLRRLTASTIGDDRARRLFAPPPPVQPPLEALRAARSPTLAALLGDEHPQVAAVIVSQLPRAQAAAVLQAMPEELQVDLVRRISGIKEVPAQMVELASEAMAKALASAGGLGAGEARADFDGVAFAAGLLNEMPPDDSEKLLGALEQLDEKVVPKVREKMFTFEDLGRLTARALQGLMREVTSDQILVALKTASEELRERFLSAISSRAAATMRDDLSSLPPTRLSDVERAQREVVDVALRLAGEGRLTLPGRGGERLV